MAKFNLTINKKKYVVDVDPQMPLLLAIRDFAGLTGTKYGCGIAECGACTIHVGDTTVWSFRLELLEKATHDPVGEVEYDPDRYAGVIRKVAEMANWGRPQEGIYGREAGRSW